MLIPNLDCVLRKRTQLDKYGQSKLGAPMPERCAIVKAKTESAHTTVRADSGASRGHADEFVTTNRILLRAATQAQIDDQLQVVGLLIRIKMMHPRYDVTGKLDHYEVEGELWG